MVEVEAGRPGGPRLSATSWVPGPVVCLLASLASGAMMFGGIGLAPVWWLTWLAPIPVLALALRVRARRAAWMAALAEIVGMTGYGYYLWWVLGGPMPGVLAQLVGAAAVLTATVLLFRALVLRGLVLLGVLAAPALWAASEYLVATLTSSGSGWVLADSQADNLPMLQIVSVTGPWGVGFVLFTVVCALAVLVAPGLASRVRVVAVAIGAAVFAAVVVPGLVALSASSPAAGSAKSLPVSVVAAARPTGGDTPRADTPAGQALIEADLTWLYQSAPPGGVVVFPEKDLVADDASMPALISRFVAAAQDRRTTVILGVEEHRGAVVYNSALVFTPDGADPLTYDKRYPIPGIEADITPGDRMAMVPGSEASVGVAICADLGQPSLGREYGRAGIGLLAAPAKDFVDDAWFSSRMQSMRGVENGYAVARAARQGLLTVTDAHGRVLAETPVDDTRTNAITIEIAGAPGGTFYSRWGDWFAWLCLALTAIGLAAIARPRTSTPAASGIGRFESPTSGAASVEHDHGPLGSR